jgi:hypothetical protein
MQAIGKQKEKSSLFLFVLISYAQIWFLYGIAKLLDMPFSMDPRQLGGLFYLFGAAAPLFATIVATVIITGKEGLNQLFRRSFAWRFSPIWYLIAVFIPLQFAILKHIMSFLCGGGQAAAIATVFLPRPLFKLQTKSHRESDHGTNM